MSHGEFEHPVEDHPAAAGAAPVEAEHELVQVARQVRVVHRSLMSAEAISDADVALDTVGGEVTASLLPALRDGGTIVTIASAPPEEAASERGIRAELLIMDAGTEELTRIGELVAAGEVRVEMAESFPLAEAARAHELSEGGHVRGKLVLWLT